MKQKTPGQDVPGGFFRRELEGVLNCKRDRILLKEISVK